MSDIARIDITKPKWDQSTYLGRVKHFFVVTNPLNILATPRQLDRAKYIYDNYRAGKPLPPCMTMDDVWKAKYLYNSAFHPDTGEKVIVFGRMSCQVPANTFITGCMLAFYKAGKPLPPCMTMDDVWKAKYLYNSAFHPDTGEKVIVFGRMSCQVPANTFITGCMLSFYKSNLAVIFWQWFNQSFNAVVNYSNRSGDNPITLDQLGVSYVLATGGALVTALSLNKLAASSPPLIGRWVPFVAVAAANCINIPCMRKKEIVEGLPVFDANHNRLGNSCIAAKEGITAVVLSRIGMAIPSMVGIPIIINKLDNVGYFKRYPKRYVSIQMALAAMFLTFATPMCCALFSQTVTVPISHLESHIQEAAEQISPVPTEGYYNKGL